MRRWLGAFSTSGRQQRVAPAWLGSQLPEKQPNDQRAMISGNRKLQNKWDIDGAIADFSRAISISPSNSGYYAIRANATKSRKRDYDGAIVDFCKLVAIISFQPEGRRGYHCRVS